MTMASPRRRAARTRRPFSQRRSSITRSSVSTGGDRLQVGHAADPGQTLVDDQPLAHVRDVALGNVCRDAELDLGLQVRLRMLAAQLAHRLLEQMGVELEPDRRDVAGLLLSQEVTRTTNLEIVRRQAES